MSLSSEAKRRAELALASTTAADELDGLLGGFMGAKVFYVHSGDGVDTALRSGESWSAPFASLDYAIGKCTAARGDVIVLRPGHAETTTAIAADVAGVRIVGLGAGRNKPALTATTGSSDLISVTAANVQIRNVRLVGAASGCTALLNIGAADFEGLGLVLEHGAAPVMAVTVVAASHRFRLVDCQWRGTAAGPDCCIDIEGKVDDWAVVRPRADYGGSSGLDLAFLRSSFKMKGYEIENPIVVSFDTLAIDINSSTAAVGDGVVTDGTFIATAALTSIEDAFDVGGAMFKECYVGDVVTGRPGPVPIATVS